MHKTKGVNPRNFDWQEESPQKSCVFQNKIPWNFAPQKIGASKTFLILQATPIVIKVHKQSIQALQFAQMHETKGVNPRNFDGQGLQ